LQYTENDAQEMADFLRSPRAGFQITALLTSSRGTKDPKQKPTANNIRVAVKKLLAGKTKHDTVLIGLAGHGIQREVPNPREKGPRRSKTFAFFCPADADLKDEVLFGSGLTRKRTLINLNELFSEMAGCGAGSKLVLVDACRNEVRARNVDVDKVTVPRGVGALFSCGPGQRAFETDKLGKKGHGVFFHFVLEGLRGKAKNNEGEVTWDGLSSYVRRQVTRQVPKVIGGGATQTPHAMDNLIGEAPPLVAPGPFHDTRKE
jgi:uncharacterized caspase-like protein